jgi:hypothetical protein
MLQLSVPDRYRGRVFAAELFAVTVMQAAISFATAGAVEWLHIEPRAMALWIGAALWLPGVGWLMFAPRMPRSGSAPIPIPTVPEQAEEESASRAVHG